MGYTEPKSAGDMLMTILLGVDTGGTYTDAVLIQDDTHVMASAKSLTTRADLALGIGSAVRAVLAQADVAPGEIALASLSTTLATNALVEGQGGRVGLVYIGFEARDLDSHGLREALKGDPVITLSGGHDHAGRPLCWMKLRCGSGWRKTKVYRPMRWPRNLPHAMPPMSCAPLR
jgi:N-methylhydantoinase A/oxoprolinase/acetone carboxylase beta subunit